MMFLGRYQNLAPLRQRIFSAVMDGSCAPSEGEVLNTIMVSSSFIGLYVLP